MSKRVITIGRQFGSDGRIIGNALAARLGINCYDKELIKLASEQIDIPYEQLKRVDEKREKPWSYQVDLDSGLDRRYRYEHIDEKLFETQSDVILRLAEREDCIIVGRCAGWVLREQPHVLNVFIHADRQERLRRAVEEYGIPQDQAASVLHRFDHRRSNFYHANTGRSWREREGYHMVLDSGLLGVELCSQLLVAAAQSEG